MCPPTPQDFVAQASGRLLKIRATVREEEEAKERQHQLKGS